MKERVPVVAVFLPLSAEDLAKFSKVCAEIWGERLEMFPIEDVDCLAPWLVFGTEVHPIKEVQDQ